MSDHPQNPDPIEPLIKRWLKSDDPDAALEELCQLHPEHADALRRRLAASVGTVSSAAEWGEPKPDQVGPYKILDTLGEGGMGTVYLAEQRDPVDRRVALKLIKLGMDSVAVIRRFEQERQALALMDHEGIAKVYDVGTSERGQPYFVMELVKGVPLDRFCADHRVTLENRLRLMQQVCAAVQHAHQKGVVHRDLKPGNVLVSDLDGRLQIKIIDFGLAKAIHSRLIRGSLHTEFGMVLGTPEYMAPEQADPSNLDIDTRADVFSLGAMLYQLLVGELPLSGAELRAGGVVGMQQMLRDVEPERPSTKLVKAIGQSSTIASQMRMSQVALRKALKSDLDWVVVKALEKDRGSRYQSPAALSEDLQHFLDHEPLEAGPPSPVYRVKKLLRRYRLHFTAAAVALVAVLVGGVFAAVQWQRAEREAEAKSVLAEQKSALADQMSALASSERDAKEAARSAAARLQAKIVEYDQLAGVVRCEQVTAGADLLLQQAPWPQASEAMNSWLRECDELLALRPGVKAAVASLEALATPWGEAQEALFAEREPAAFERWRMQGRILRSLQRAEEIRSGRRPLEEVQLTAEQQAMSASKLNLFAWVRVSPRYLDRDPWGEEAVGLAAAQLAVEKAADSSQRCHYLDTLAWAWFANGKDARAIQASAQAKEASFAGSKQKYERYLAAVTRAVERSPQALASAAAAYEERPVWDFEPGHESEAFLHQQLRELLDQLDELDGRRRPLIAQRSAWAQRIEGLTRAHPNARVTWAAVRDGLAVSERYAGCDIPLGDGDITQRWLGLVPIGANPVTGLYEFYHLRSACDGDPDEAAALAIPSHRADGSIAVGRETGIVFALLPGGAVTVGSQREDPAGANYDRQRDGIEQLRKADLEPFLLARHELTQGQWARLWPGARDVQWPSGTPAGADHPVEMVGWEWSAGLLRSHGLALPTEVQWEYGCRAGTQGPWSVAEAELVRYANLRGQDDGHGSHAPVGSFLPNGFGLYDMHGNVWEWCSNLHRTNTFGSVATARREFRGGAFNSAPADARSARRVLSAPGVRYDLLGLRASRRVKAEVTRPAAGR